MQLISGVKIAEMSQLQNCSAMCINNGSYHENEKIIREKVRGRGICTRNGSYCERENVRGVRVGVNGKVQAFVKIHFFIYFFGGGGGGVRVDVNEEVMKLL